MTTPENINQSPPPEERRSGVDDRRLVLCPVCGGTGQMLFPIHTVHSVHGYNMTATGQSTCFLCLGHGEIHKLKKQMLDRGEIETPKGGYYLPKGAENDKEQTPT